MSKWLSPDGGRDGGVQVTIVWAETTLILDGQTFYHVGPKNPPTLQGQSQHVCAIYAALGPDSFTGTAIVAVVPKAT